MKHTDKILGIKAEDKFKEITEVYEVLSDTKTRNAINWFSAHQ